MTGAGIDQGGAGDGAAPGRLGGSGDAVVWARSKADGGLLFCSPEFFEWTGTSDAELQRDRNAWMKAVHPDDRPRLERASESLAREALVWRLLRPDGQLRWVRTRVLDIEGAESLGFWLGLAEDVTDQVADLELQERTTGAETALRALLADPSQTDLDTVAAAAAEIISGVVDSPVGLRLQADPAVAPPPDALPVTGPDGLVPAVLVSAVDPVRRRALERLAPVVWHVLSTVRLRAEGGQASRVIEALLAGESVIGELAATLADVSAADLDATVTGALGRLGVLVGADRAYLFQYNASGRLDNTHEWCADGIEPAIDMLQDLDPEEFGWLTAHLAEGRTAFIDVAALGPEAAAEKEILQAQDIKTLALVPMLRRSELVGFVGFDAVRVAREWGGYEASLLAWFVRLVDITLSRARLEERLTSSERRFRGFADQARENLFLFTPGQRGGTYTNAAYERVFGQPVDEWYADHWQSLLRALHPDDRAWMEELVGPLIETPAPQPGFTDELGHVFLEQYRVVHPDGTTRWVEARLFPVLDDEGRLVNVGGIAEDITARKDLELGLVEARDEAERASAAKSDFIFKSSHELRTPLNAVQGFAFLVRRAHDEAERERYLDRLEEAVGALAGIVEDLLMLGRAETGSRAAEPGPVRLAPVLGDVVALLEPQATTARIEVACDVPDVTVRGDADTVEHVFRNLVDNAVKYNRPGGHVTIAARAEGADVLVDIVDDGLGIPSARLAMIWEPFERIGAEATATPGSGLGLSIVRALVHRLGGSIEVRSEEGRGSVFSVRLPRWPESPTDLDRPSDGQGARVALVASANADSRDLLAAVLEHAGFDRVELVAGVAAAERALRDQRPAMAVLESDLGDGYATDVLGAIERHGRRLPVVVIAGRVDADDERRFREAGAVAVLTVPIDVPGLTSLARDALTRADPAGSAG